MSMKKVTWFREKRKRDGDEDEIPLPARKRIVGERKIEKKVAGKKEVAIKAVMFIPFTTGRRQGCLLCETKLKTEKNLSQDCHTRNLVYETWCMTCLRKEEREIEIKYVGDARKIRERKDNI